MHKGMPYPEYSAFTVLKKVLDIGTKPTKIATH